MNYNIFALITGLAYCLIMTLICFSAVKRSSFGYLIIFCEYFYILGLGPYLVASSLGLLDVSPILENYELAVAGLSKITFLHIFLYGLGSLFGYFSFRSISKNLSRKLITLAARCSFSNETWFYCSAISSIALSLLYLVLVGVDTALLNASAARGGDFSGLEGFQQYSFIKTIAQLGVFSVISLPFIITKNKHLPLSFLIITIMAAFLYMQSVARVVFLDTVFLFVMFYLTLTNKNKSAIALAAFTGAFLLFVVVYGKEFVGVFSAFLFTDGELAFTTKYDSLISYLFSQFGHLAYTIDAGIRNFMRHGPIIPTDILLSPVGFLPSSVFSALGIPGLSYQLVEDTQRLSCINTVYFLEAEKCSMPPYITGFSAYMFPVFGGFLFGFFRFFIFGILESAWILLRNNPEHLWIVIASLLVLTRFMLIIAPSISFAMFAVFTIAVFIISRKFVVRFSFKL